MIGDQRVVYQFAEHGDRLVAGGVVGVAQGVADAEAHAEMGSESDFHELWICCLDLGPDFWMRGIVTLCHKVIFQKNALLA